VAGSIEGKGLRDQRKCLPTATIAAEQHIKRVVLLEAESLAEIAAWLRCTEALVHGAGLGERQCKQLKTADTPTTYQIWFGLLRCSVWRVSFGLSITTSKPFFSFNSSGRGLPHNMVYNLLCGCRCCCQQHSDGHTPCTSQQTHLRADVVCHQAPTVWQQPQQLLRHSQGSPITGTL
jgi:hypothetical protein